MNLEINVMNDTHEAILDHEIDGITELDNKLPRWWVWLFNLCIVFSFVYMIVFHVLRIAPLPARQYEKEIANASAAAAPTPAPGAPDTAAVAVAAQTEEPSKDEATLAKGKEIFKANCAVCHGQNAGGLIGPNMCDDSWIHGPKFSDSLHIIREGVPAKGMITWKAILKPEDIQAVGSYLYTLRGSNPPNPKAPEGVKADS
jgi:cytochrome c oxidase cbb3-type subunit 3